MRAMLLAAAATAASLLVGCKTISTREVTFERHQIGVRVLSTVIDEYEGTVEYSLLFRNNGREIASFDYTVADRPGVPHVDKEGPNSGLIENLYPGAEIELPNPLDDMAVHVTLGTVTYGKKAKDELLAIYEPGAFIKKTAPAPVGVGGLDAALLDDTPYDPVDDAGGL